MKTQELRQGNLIYTDKHKDEVGVVRGFLRGRVFVSTNGGELETDIENIHPIELSEEWLLDFGWKIQFVHKGVTSFIRHDTDYDSINLSEGRFYWNCWETTVNPTHVHLLQNFHYANTGKELNSARKEK